MGYRVTQDTESLSLLSAHFIDPIVKHERGCSPLRWSGKSSKLLLPQAVKLTFYLVLTQK